MRVDSVARFLHAHRTEVRRLAAAGVFGEPSGLPTHRGQLTIPRSFVEKYAASREAGGAR